MRRTIEETVEYIRQRLYNNPTSQEYVDIVVEKSQSELTAIELPLLISYEQSVGRFVNR